MYRKVNASKILKNNLKIVDFIFFNENKMQFKLKYITQYSKLPYEMLYYALLFL